MLEAVQDLRALGPVDRDAAVEAVARLSVRFRRRVGARPRGRARPAPGAYPPLPGGVRARPRGGEPPGRVRRAAGARRRRRRGARRQSPGCRRGRAAPLHDRVHPPVGAAGARPPGGHRRGEAARALAVLGRGRARPRRPRSPARAPPRAGRRLLPARRGAVRPRAAARARTKPSRRRRLGDGRRGCDGLGATARAGRLGDQARLGRSGCRASRRPRRDRPLLRHRAREVRRLLVDVVRRAGARPASDRLRARRPHARLDRPRHAGALLRAAPGGGGRRAPRPRRPARRVRAHAELSGRRAGGSEGARLGRPARSSPARSSAIWTPSCARRPTLRFRSSPAGTRSGSGARCPRLV